MCERCGGAGAVRHKTLIYQLFFRAAAEWILRCGGGVKFKKPNIWLWDYNALPQGPKGQYLIEGINAKETSVTTGGLLHLGTHLNGSVNDLYCQLFNL